MQSGTYKKRGNSGTSVEKRFIVRSAQEAVDQVREVLGPGAQVISVRQVKGGGLQRFLASPRLEVIARAYEPETKPKKATREDSLNPSDAFESADSDKKEEAGKVDLSEHSPESISSVKEAVPSHAVQSTSTEIGPGLRDRLKKSSVQDLKCGKFLIRAGFSNKLVARMSAGGRWREICDMSIQDGLTHAISFLREYRKEIHTQELSQRIAFVGGAGSGKTTALCKLLARDVFIKNALPQVLRVEVDKPHLDDGLPLYCSVLGVTCCRSESELNLDSEDPIYVDVPGYSLTAHRELDRIRNVLDELKVNSRVMVLNGAYEESIISRFLDTGAQLGAQFEILSHVDELVSVGKIWEHLLSEDRKLLCLSNGQNVASDLIEDVFGFLLERTFPR